VSGDYFLSGEVEAAAKAKFEDYVLLRMFQRTEKPESDDKEVVKALRKAF